jgi:2-dehydro-3-deoxygluconokinase
MEGITYGLRTSKLALTHYGDLTHVTPSELQIPTSTDILR